MGDDDNDDDDDNQEADQNANSQMYQIEYIPEDVEDSDLNDAVMEEALVDE
jgi:hypothetical protein